MKTFAIYKIMIDDTAWESMNDSELEKLSSALDDALEDAVNKFSEKHHWILHME